MVKKLVTIDDIVRDDDDENDDDVFGHVECSKCPDRRKCRIKRALAFARIDFMTFLAKVCRTIFLMFKPIFNAINKRRGGIECPWCHVYGMDPGEYCRNCGKSYHH